MQSINSTDRPAGRPIALSFVLALGAAALLLPSRAEAQPKDQLSLVAIPEAEYQAAFNRAVAAGKRLVWLDGYDVNNRTFFNAIFGPADGTTWIARHGMTSSQYQQVFTNLTSAQQGYRPLQVESYMSGGQVRYAAIFVKKGGPRYVAYHGLSAAQHQERFDSLRAQGYRPINVSVVSPSGARTYTALYERRNVGSYVLRSFLTPAQYQTAFNNNLAAGREPVYLNAYTHNGNPRFSAIWHQTGPSPFYARHGLTLAQYQAQTQLQLAQDRVPYVITGYESNGQHRFAVLWSE